MGRFINIEAIDRAGKSTQAEALLAALRGRGLRVAGFDFPDTPRRAGGADRPGHLSTGVLIERYLDDRLDLMDGRDSIFRLPGMRDLDPETRERVCANIIEKLIQMLYSVNRRERAAELRTSIEANDVTLVTRWHSARTYGVACGVSRLQIDAIEGELPVPDLTVLLDIDPAAARLRRAEAGLDRYEEDTDLQSRVRALYAEMVRLDAAEAAVEGRPERFVRLDAELPVEDLTARIEALVLERLR